MPHGSLADQPVHTVPTARRQSPATAALEGGIRQRATSASLPKVSERFTEAPSSAWSELSQAERGVAWGRFEARFGFRASVTPDGWPAIAEPAPSLTFDLSGIHDGPMRGAAYDAINAEALRAFLWALPEVDELLVLDWQHPAYRFSTARQALTWRGEWRIPVYPDGDYYAFLTDDMTEGTFGHPWEQTLCVMGPRLAQSLGASLSTWLPILRRDGQPVTKG